MPREPAQDFYFSASEARGEYFANKTWPQIVVYKTRIGQTIWATEVTAPGARPVSRSRDLICVGRGIVPSYTGRENGKQGDLWGALKEA